MKQHDLRGGALAVIAGLVFSGLGSAAYGQCGPSPRLVEVSQESAPGLADFNDNILGYLLPYATTGTATDFYAYDPANGSWNGACLTGLVDKRSHLLLADTSDGLTLVIVHDNVAPGGALEGRAEMRFELINDANGAVRTVEDDPGKSPYADIYTGDPGDASFASVQVWNECCTDGLALSGLDGGWSMILRFTEVDGDGSTPPIDGLNEWNAYSADGSTIHLELQEDRRVRLRSTEPCPRTCTADVDGDGTVGIADFLALLAAWGPCS